MKRVKIDRCVDRVDHLKSLCANKTVLHLGCAAAGQGGTLEKVADGSLLHQTLGSVAQALYGVDIDAKSIEIMQAHGIPNVFVGDCQELNEMGLPRSFDVVLAANVFNLVADYAKVLEGAKKLLKPGGELIISIDNAYSLKKFLRYVFLHVDMSLSSQVWHASPASLEQMLFRFGFTATEMCSFWVGPDIFRKQSLKSELSNYILAPLPGSAYIADGLIVRARRG
jgi:2-polyprenyl-3-methyl-5-hydroxy-6-metoxy-1,4-benzoquinol methylase